MPTVCALTTNSETALVYSRATISLLPRLTSDPPGRAISNVLFPARIRTQTATVAIVALFSRNISNDLRANYSQTNSFNAFGMDTFGGGNCSQTHRSPAALVQTMQISSLTFSPSATVRTKLASRRKMHSDNGIWFDKHFHAKGLPYHQIREPTTAVWLRTLGLGRTPKL